MAQPSTRIRDISADALIILCLSCWTQRSQRPHRCSATGLQTPSEAVQSNRVERRTGTAVAALAVVVQTLVSTLSRYALLVSQTVTALRLQCISFSFAIHSMRVSTKTWVKVILRFESYFLCVVREFLLSCVHRVSQIAANRHTNAADTAVRSSAAMVNKIVKLENNLDSTRKITVAVCMWQYCGCTGTFVFEWTNKVFR